MHLLSLAPPAFTLSLLPSAFSSLLSSSFPSPSSLLAPILLSRTSALSSSSSSSSSSSCKDRRSHIARASVLPEQQQRLQLLLPALPLRASAAGTERERVRKGKEGRREGEGGREGEREGGRRRGAE
eukprot:3684430-Rhodomonas_salina.1